MKKSILFVFALIPLLASCNQNENGFVNPFPDDEYNKIGFNIQEEGKIVRSLTSQETSQINTTIESAKKDNLYTNIKEESVEFHQRDYTRAFAGEFAQGYYSSNQKIDGKFTIYRQDPDDSNDIEYLRNVTEIDLTEVNDYSYGRNTIKTQNIVYRYLAKETNEGSKKYTEVAPDSDPKCTFMQTYEGAKSIQPEGTGILTKSESISGWYEPDISISQADSIFYTTEATSLPGANKNGDPVLIKESHSPYNKGKEEGIYELQDGRRYRAAINELVVSTLNLVKLKKDDPEPAKQDWYIVERARHYSETVITSDVIQPNVPISYLANPIVIAYTEEIFTFSDKLTHTTQTPTKMDDVELKELIK